MRQEDYNITKVSSGNKDTMCKPVKDQEVKTARSETSDHLEWYASGQHVRYPNGRVVSSDHEFNYKSWNTKAIASLSNGKGLGPGIVPVQALKVSRKTTANMLHLQVCHQ